MCLQHYVRYSLSNITVLFLINELLRLVIPEVMCLQIVLIPVQTHLCPNLRPQTAFRSLTLDHVLHGTGPLLSVDILSFAVVSSYTLSPMLTVKSCVVRVFVRLLDF